MKNIIFIAFALSIPLISFSQNEKLFEDRLSYSFDSLFAPFYHGVASGDPLADKVIIWTRVTSFNQMDSIQVQWYFATDSACTNIIQSGTYTTDESIDYTVKIDVTGLSPDTWYYYYFEALNKNSIIGRTRTNPTGDNDSLRYAVVSGSNYNSGYFNAYRTLAERNDIDGVIHLGDYIYEYGTDGYGDHPDRALEPSYEILALSDYRMRYSHYRLDPDLRYAHQQYPWYIIYDDHETANNSYKDGAENHDSGTEGNWYTRKAAGIQAFYEWIPIREINDTANPENKIHRKINMGDLADMIFIDTRLEGRDDPEGLNNDDPNKTMLGSQQYNWLTQELYNSQYTTGVQWKIIANQVMMAPLLIAGIVANSDQWDGYQAERQNLLNYINGMGIKNPVVITGDIHTSWANDVPNPTLGNYGSNGQGVGAVEFVTPSVTSPSVDFGGGIGSAVIQAANPHMQWVELVSRGYYILDINKIRCQADWYFLNTIDDTIGFAESFANAYFVNDQENFLRHSSMPSYRFPPYPALAPEYPSQLVNAKYTNSNFVVLGSYPNPFTKKFTVQFFTKEPGDYKLYITDINGKKVFEETYTSMHSDMVYHVINAEELKAGTYILNVISENNRVQQKKIMKIK